AIRPVAPPVGQKPSQRRKLCKSVTAIVFRNSCVLFALFLAPMIATAVVGDAPESRQSPEDPVAHEIRYAITGEIAVGRHHAAIDAWHDALEAFYATRAYAPAWFAGALA